MYLVRDLFRAKPGKAKDLVAIFKKATPHFEKDGMFKNGRIMTDIVAGYWTVVMESEVESLAAFEDHARSATSKPEVQSIMKGYMDLVDGGHREIFKIE